MANYFNNQTGAVISEGDFAKLTTERGGWAVTDGDINSRVEVIVLPFNSAVTIQANPWQTPEDRAKGQALVDAVEACVPEAAPVVETPAPVEEVTHAEPVAETPTEPIVEETPAPIEEPPVAEPTPEPVVETPAEVVPEPAPIIDFPEFVEPTEATTPVEETPTPEQPAA